MQLVVKVINGVAQLLPRETCNKELLAAVLVALKGRNTTRHISVVSIELLCKRFELMALLISYGSWRHDGDV